MSSAARRADSLAVASAIAGRQVAPSTAPEAKEPVEAMPPIRLAAIDIGTNSVRLLVVDAFGPDDYRTVDDEKVTTRLGEGFSTSGLLSAVAMQRTLDAVINLKAIAEGRGANRIQAVATSAVREASNGHLFTARLSDEAGIVPQVISGNEEAQLAYLSARHNFHLGSERVVCLDIGGGSLELVSTTGAAIQQLVSLPLGAVRLTERFVHSDPISKPDWQALRDHIRGELERALGEDLVEGAVLIGSGGTVSSLARVIAHQRGDKITRIHGYVANRSAIRRAIDLFRSLDLEGRRHLEGLSADRADIILAGVEVVNEVMRLLHLNSIVVNEHGIRAGIILTMTREIFGSPATGPADWRESVRALGQACHYEPAECEHVAKLAVALFDALAELHHFDEGERRLVEAAALLRNVGHHVSYEKHHIHSYHLIRHANLPGFSPREIELLANIARYHRRALPQKSHPNFGRLSRTDRLRVCRLGGIVRFVDGLDRSHRRRVSGIEARLDRTQVPPELLITLLANGPIDIEMWGAAQKRDLLEQAFDIQVTLAAAPPGTSAAAEGQEGKEGKAPDPASGAGTPRPNQRR
jgi:exopolyphosphatase/guanosine-5'-triphosphate,3'-diphosphate pyrophosphatase